MIETSHGIRVRTIGSVSLRRVYLLLGCVLLLAAFLRLYRFAEYVHFAGDEGRDAIVVMRMLVYHQFPLLGPDTSVGSMHLGPLYYYMMAIPMSISWLDPVAAAAMVAVLDVATVGLIFFIGYQWFGLTSAVIGALLYSVSPIAILHARMSWNPNPAPFFALLTMIGLYKARVTRNYLWLSIVGASLGAILQMHLLTLALIPVVGILWLLELKSRDSWQARARHFWTGSLIALLVFVALMSPLVVSDVTNHFQNLHALRTFVFGNRGVTSGITIPGLLTRGESIYVKSLIDQFVAGPEVALSVLVSTLVLAPIAYGLYQLAVNRRLIWPLLALGMWLGSAILALAVSGQVVYDHYLLFVSPAPFLLIASLGSIVQISEIPKGLRRPLALSVIGLVVVLVGVNAVRSPLLKEPQTPSARAQGIAQSQAIAQYVVQRVGDSPYKIVLVSRENYDGGYQYYLNLYGHPPAEPPVYEHVSSEQPQVEPTKMFVVCEDQDCIPTGAASRRIAAFGPALLAAEATIGGVRVDMYVKPSTSSP